MILISKANTKFCLRLHYNADNSYLFVNEKEIYKFKASNKSNSFPSQFCLGSISNDFNTLDLDEASLVEMYMIFQIIRALLIYLIF